MKRLGGLLLLLTLTAFAAPPKKGAVARPPPDVRAVERAAQENAAAREDDRTARPNDAIAPDDGTITPDDDTAHDGNGAKDEESKVAPDLVPGARAKPTNDLTDDQAAAIGLVSLCCCFFGFAALVALIIWLVRRSSKAAAPIASAGVPSIAAPAAAAGNPMQLSIFALGLDPLARGLVEQQLQALGVELVPQTPESRGKLVREAARALLQVQASWKQFGYGEKPGLAELLVAQTSYRAASEDFRARAYSVGTTAPAHGGLVVVTLLICSRRPLLGVSRLDEPLQVRDVLEDRSKVLDAELLGAELLWSPAAPDGRISEAEVSLRFPEMQPLSRPV